jgi:hypothetical protein
MIQVPFTQRAVSRGSPVAGFGVTQPADGGAGAGITGAFGSIAGSPGNRGLFGGGGTFVGLAMIGGVSNGGDHEPPRQLHPAPGHTPRQLPAPPEPPDVVADPPGPLAGVVPTITQMPF